MSVADTSFPFAVPPATDATPLPAPPTPSGAVAAAAAPRPLSPLPPQQVAPWNLPRPPRAPRPDGLDPITGRVLGASVGVAYVLAATIEPMPDGPMPDLPLWQLPIELAALGAVIAAGIVVWRGGRNGARLGAAAGVLMAVLTVACLLAGHSTVGWWTWVQTGLSLYVMGTSAVLMARTGRQAPRPPR